MDRGSEASLSDEIGSVGYDCRNPARHHCAKMAVKSGYAHWD